MKAKIGCVLMASSLQLTVVHANDDLDEMYKTKNCFACHRIDRHQHGPTLKSIAEKYATVKQADQLLAKRIREGSVGVWGQTPMPPQPQVTEAEALTLARWILALK
jgi:cytochrome c